MMIYLNFFEKTCAWLMTLTMCGGSWQVKIRRRMWKAWHTLLTTVYPWMKLLWNCGQVLQNTALFKCDGFGLLQPNFGS